MRGLPAELNALPPQAQRLTWWGAAPFGVAVVASVVGPWQAKAAPAFIAYGAVILSFLGGIRWGRAMSLRAPAASYVLAVLPSLWAFPALLLPVPWALAAMALGFSLVLWYDTRAETLHAPPDFPILRIRITALVLLLHALMGGILVVGN